MIPRPATLAAAYGASVVEPAVQLTFRAPDGTVTRSVPILGGTYEVRSDRWPRAELEVTVPAGITAKVTASPVSPYGGTVDLDMGAVVPGRGRILIPVASLDVYETRIARPSGIITVRAVSHEARVNENRYASRSATPAGKTSDVVTQLVRRTLGATHQVRNLLGADDPHLAAGDFPLEADLWPTIEAIMDEADAQARFDEHGALVLEREPVKATTPVITLATGESTHGTLTGYESVRGWAYNAVAVVYREDSGDSPGKRVGTWEDSTSTSGTHTAYGTHRWTERVSVDAGKLPSQARADKAARTLARRRQDPYRSVRLDAVPAPWLEPGDTVRVNMLGALSELLLLRSVRLDLTGLAPMTLDARDPAYTAT